MNRDDLKKLVKLCFDNGLDVWTINAAMHIAMDHCEDEAMITAYGTNATNALKALRMELYKQ